MTSLHTNNTDSEMLGRVNTVNGSSVRMEFESLHLPQRVTVGTFVAISTGDR